MKKFLLASYVVALLCACNTNPSERQVVAGESTKGFVNEAWSDVLDAHMEQAKDLLFEELKEESDFYAQCSFIAEKDIDLSRKDLIDLKALPTYRLDSAALYRLTPQSDFESVVKLDMKHAHFMVFQRGSIILTMRASYNDGWRDVDEISNGPLETAHANLIKAFNAGEDVVMVEVYKKRKTPHYYRFAFIKSNGSWISAVGGSNAVEYLIAWRDMPEGLR